MTKYLNFDNSLIYTLDDFKPGAVIETKSIKHPWLGRLKIPIFIAWKDRTGYHEVAR